MHQGNNSPRDNGDNLYHELATQATAGKWPLILRIFYGLIRIHSLFISVFIRRRIGLNHFGFGNFFLSGFVSYVFYFLIASECWIQVCASGNVNGLRFSGGLFLLHVGAFNAVYLIKWAVAGLSVRSKDPVWFRHRLSIGESIFYPTIYRLLKLVDLVDDGNKNPSFWKMTEAKWMQFFEPALTLVLGLLVRKIGYGAFGTLLIISAICLCKTTFQAYTNSALPIQSDKEGKMLRPLVEHGNNDALKEPQKVIRD